MDTFDVIDQATAPGSPDFVGPVQSSPAPSNGFDFSSFMSGLFNTGIHYVDRLSNSPSAYPGGVVPRSTFPPQQSSVFGSSTLLLVIVAAVVIWAILDHRKKG